MDIGDVFDKNKSDILVERLMKNYGISLRNIPVPAMDGRMCWPIRISTHVWLSANEIDMALDTIFDEAMKLQNT